VQIRVGPVAATFKSNVELSDLDPPRAYTIVGTGNAGAVGFAKVTARVQLEPEAETTVLAYDADVEIGGKLMSVGSRLIQSAAGKNLDACFGSRTTRHRPAACNVSRMARRSRSPSRPNQVRHWVCGSGWSAQVRVCSVCWLDF
jgi:hypothetical protein